MHVSSAELDRGTVQNLVVMLFGYRQSRVDLDMVGVAIQLRTGPPLSMSKSLHSSSVFGKLVPQISPMTLSRKLL